MKVKFFAILLPIVLALAFGVQAQTGQMQGQQEKFTGCLQSGTEPNTFMLTNVKTTQARTGETPSELARTETSYTLVPQGKVNLKRHVGHEVEVTGIISEEETSPTAQLSSDTKIAVSSIGHISNTCR